jgi:CheY-like chemotaxis protein
MNSRVFVVDDEPMVASTTAAVLQLNGYEVRSFVNSLEALDAARAVKPDLVIADVVMPGLSGIDLAIQLKYWPSQFTRPIFWHGSKTPLLLKAPDFQCRWKC